METAFQLINYIRPALATGTYRIDVKQDVSIAPKSSGETGDNDVFNHSESFHVAYTLFALKTGEVFSVYPGDNEEGDFARILPHITLHTRTFPWQIQVTPDLDGTPVPWVALLVLGPGEAVESELKISEVCAPPEELPKHLFTPDMTAYPPLFADKMEDSCRVIDMSKSLYTAIMPNSADLTCLTHVKKINLAKTEDKVTALDGFFSVMIANRFPASGHTEAVENTCHLVSLIGLAGRAIPETCTQVRLVSLYRWRIFSKSEHVRTFTDIVNDLSKNSGAIGAGSMGGKGTGGSGPGGSGTTGGGMNSGSPSGSGTGGSGTTGGGVAGEMLSKGYALKRHILRTGENTYSLYRSPLIPYKNEPADPLNGENKHTADGRLIYHEKTGIFDVSYAAAFQLGRMITLSRKSMAEKVIAWRKSIGMREHTAAIKEQISFESFDFAQVCMDLYASAEGEDCETPNPST